MRPIASSLLGATLIGLLVACGATTSDGPLAQPDNAQPEIATLAFNVWNCTDLECLNLETSETATHAYTACSAVLDDAENVGIGICEQRKTGTSVVSKPAKCVPLGTPCPLARAAYAWDDVRKKRADDVVDDGDDDAGVAPADASGE